MNIYYITGIVLDDQTAPSIHVDEICKNLIEAGHNVTLYAPGSKKASSREYPAQFISTPSSMPSAFYQFKLFLKLFNDFRRNRPDIIYSRHEPILIVPALCAKLFRIPLILEVNGWLPSENNPNGGIIERVFLRLKIFTMLEKINFTLGKALITVTPGIKNLIAENYHIPLSKINVIANGVDTLLLKPIPTKDARIKIGLETDKIYIGYIGGLQVWQGVKYIAEAAKIISTDRSDIKFLIIGAGAEANFIKSFIQNNGLEKSLELRAPIPHNLVPLHINALDICVNYPLKLRGGVTSPFKIYEYLSCGKAVVSSDISGMREEFGEVISYAAAESTEALATNLLSLANNLKLREKLGADGRKFVEKEHSWRRVTQRIIDVCKKVL